MRRLLHRLAHLLRLNGCEAVTEWVSRGTRMRVGTVCRKCGHRTADYDAFFALPLWPEAIARGPCGSEHPLGEEFEAAFTVR